MSGRIVVIGVDDTTFTAVCEACGATFAGRLDLDLTGGVFLCRGGHATHVARAEPPQESAAVTAA